MSKVKNILAAENENLKLRIEELEGQLYEFRHRDLIEALRREYRFPPWLWCSQRLTEKLWDLEKEEQMREILDDIRTVWHREIRKGEVRGMGEESDVHGETETTREQIKKKLRLVPGGRE